MTIAAAPLLAATLTRDPRLVAGLATATTLPWLLFPLLSGALVDRWDRRRVMWTVDAFRAVVVGAIAIGAALDVLELPILYAAFFVLGTAETLFDNASQAILPSVVARDRLADANGALQGAEIVTNQLAGPALGGVLFAATASLPFFVDAATFACAAVLVVSMRGRYGRDPGPRAPTTLRSDIAEGLRYLFSHRLLRSLAILLGVWNLVALATTSTLVLLAQERLGLGAAGYGVLLGVGAVGGVLGSVVAGRVVRRFGEGAPLPVLILAGACSAVVPALTHSVVAVAASFALFGMVGVIWNVITVSLRQSIIPDRLLGRVNSVYRLLAWGGMPLGALLGGFVANRYGLTAPYWVAAATQLVMAVVAIPLLNQREVDRARAGA